VLTFSSAFADDCTDIAATASIKQNIVPSGLFITHTTPDSFKVRN